MTDDVKSTQAIPNESMAEVARLWREKHCTGNPTEAKPRRETAVTTELPTLPRVFVVLVDGAILELDAHEYMRHPKYAAMGPVVLTRALAIAEQARIVADDKRRWTVAP